MLKKRLIPVLLLQNGLLVRSELFKKHQVIGNPIHEVERFNQWSVDELIYLDISKDNKYDLGRDDAKVKNFNNLLDIIEAVSRTCFMPLACGGKIRTLHDMRQRFLRGADKITINSEAWRNPNIISEASKVFGSQAIVVSIDVKRNDDGKYLVYVDGGRTLTNKTPEEWAHQAEDLGAGEILLQSIDKDGTGDGYDIDLISKVVASTKIPVIALAGVGQFEDYEKGIEAGASAVAAANLWHFKEFADKQGKQALSRAGIDVRI